MVASWRRWQDWLSALVGVLVFITPFVFQQTSQQAASWTAWVVGVLSFAVAMGLLARPHVEVAEGIQVVLGVLLFLAPFALGITGIATLAWPLWILGAVLGLSALSVLFLTGRRPEALIQ